MGLSQADAARRLDVSQCGPTTLGPIPIRRFCVQKTCFRPTTSYNTCRRPFSSSFDPKEKKHYCAAAFCRPLCSVREKNLRYYGALRRLHNAGLRARRPVVAPPRLFRARPTQASSLVAREQAPINTLSIVCSIDRHWLTAILLQERAGWGKETKCNCGFNSGRHPEKGKEGKHEARD
ncbi:hypothetical protein AVEN_269244-1 [Araneus ventricosus]|uniref:Uncharacterized protein n=1 Tax=Araneus ventricosus TaxID=182803 RepID=A0A4Y2TRK8_ARAVE|nr:hypothetical protein AVEN_269244-1 [Araneus ventricosus]